MARCCAAVGLGFGARKIMASEALFARGVIDHAAALILRHIKSLEDPRYYVGFLRGRGRHDTGR